MPNFLDEVKGMESQPDQEIFKIGPETIQEFVAKVIVMMGGEPDDIENIRIGQDKKRLRIIASICKDSRIFDCEEENVNRGSLIMAGAAAQTEKSTELSGAAKEVLRDLGFSYKDNDDREVFMVNVTEYKKDVEIEFHPEVTLAIITNSDFSDEYFNVDAVEEVLKKKKYQEYKFKGKKKTIVFARVQRSAGGPGFDPKQVVDWKLGYDDEDEDDDDDDC